MSTQYQRHYLTEAFQYHAESSYECDDKKAFSNSAILKMIYTLEWMKIRPWRRIKKVMRHPDITQGDFKSITYIRNTYVIENTLTGFCFGLIFGSRILWKKSSSVSSTLSIGLLKSRMLRGIGWASLTALCGMAVNRTIMDWFLTGDLEKGNLTRYLYVDYDKTELESALRTYGIKI
jgi:hypothetical protein